MLHEIEDLEKERARVSARPDADSAPPVLAFFEVTVDGDPEQYAGRLRAVMDAVLGIAASESFDDDELPVDSIPAWFPAVCRGGASPEAFAAEGRDRYRERTGGEPWDLQNWLSRFDPDLEVRGWAWWDLTRPDGGTDRLRLWADTWGEPFFAWEDLRWLLHACGARTVADPVIAKSPVWAGEPAV
ncbi:hypothetical protein ABTX85_04735 [Streptomyces sp. NPDC096097]|uniref:hypothetical protein n=1 Tax=Streptomyces sp. NPDC096097 TaxID=3155546 RepID=UPI0033337C1D